MRLLTFNVNGIRSWFDYYKKCHQIVSFDQALDTLHADIICMQETKANERSKLDWSMLDPHTYKATFAFPRKPKKIGHAGVAIFSKWTPTWLTDSMASYYECEGEQDMAIMKRLDNEGRFLAIAFGAELAIVNVYCPNDSLENADLFEERKHDRRLFFNALKSLVKALAKDFKHVFIVGDFNVSYHPIDHCDFAKRYLDSKIEGVQDTTGHALLEEFYCNERPIRKWFHAWIEAEEIVDCFRQFHPMEPFRYTCWNTKVSARVSNHGTRIDTILYKGPDSRVLIDCDQMNEYQGSDHCPVWTDLHPIEIQEGSCKSNQAKLTSFFKAGNQEVSSQGHKEPREKKTKVSLADYVQRIPSEHVESQPASPPHPHSQCLSGSPVKAVEQSQKWESLFKEAASRKKPPPLCPKHSKPCVMLRVSKKGINNGRYFYTCSLPVPDRCDFFSWLNQ